MAVVGKRPVERRALAETLLRRDPCCLLHGVFLILAKPIIRVSRILSGFIEAHDVATVLTGGARLDRYDPSGPAEKGKGNILFDRTVYTASELVAYFNLDLQALRGYGLSEGLRGSCSTWRCTRSCAS